MDLNLEADGYGFGRFGDSALVLVRPIRNIHTKMGQAVGSNLHALTQRKGVEALFSPKTS